jgi:glycosyltransferase involved in cell wall biosynthesis
MGFAIENTKEELLQALKTLYTDTEQYQRFSLREKELFQERFSAERDIEAIGKLIKSLIE